jgi:hypothetical protein
VEKYLREMSERCAGIVIPLLLAASASNTCQIDGDKHYAPAGPLSLQSMKVVYLGRRSLLGGTSPRKRKYTAM